MASRSMRAVETGTGAAPTAPASLRPADAAWTPGPPGPAAAAGLAPEPPPGGPVGAAGVGVLGGASGMGGGGGLAGAGPDGAPPPTGPPPADVPAPPPMPPPLPLPAPPAGACVLAAGSVGMTGGVTGCSGLAALGVTGCCATGTDLLVASMALAASGAPPPLAPRPGSAPASGRPPVPWPGWVSLLPVAGLASWLVAALDAWVPEEEEALPEPPLALPPLPPTGEDDVGEPLVIVGPTGAASVLKGVSDPPCEPGTVTPFEIGCGVAD